MNGQIFSISVDRWLKATNDQLDALARQACQEMAEEVVRATPVDTGFLRASWQPSIGEALLAENVTAPVADTAELRGSIALGWQSVMIGAIIPEVKVGDVFYMLNNCVYAKRVEFGFVGEDSLGRKYNQAGRYFVTDTVARWPGIVSRIADELGI